MLLRGKAGPEGERLQGTEAAACSAVACCVQGRPMLTNSEPERQSLTGAFL